ncbi:MAG: LysM peptidoglycan-binding domain-containing protein [Chloroflexi bacterium]|nr:LysM peptidoglycan-binding domain-containing protein [Chloroflexota bacterium]
MAPSRQANLGQQFVVGAIILVAIIGTLAAAILLTLGESAIETANVTPTATATQLLPSATGPATRVTQVTPSPTSTATVTASPSPTPVTASPTTTPHPPSATPETCRIPDAWFAYRVQRGDTLSSIGRRVGLSGIQLQRSNCLDSSTIYEGQFVYVPVQPAPIATPTLAAGTLSPSITPVLPTPGVTAGACTDPNSRITSPAPGSIVRGVTRLWGSAQTEAFDFYKLEIKPSGTGDPFVTFYDNDQPISQDVLHDLVTTRWPNGDYFVRLVVVDVTGNYPERCSVLYTFAN